MILVWGIVIVLAVGVIAGQIAYARSLSGVRGTGPAVVVRAINAVLLLVALGLAGYATYVAVTSGGM